jgi:UPF0755 protein
MRLIKRLLLLCLLGAVGFSGWMAWFASAAVPLKVNPSGTLEFDIRHGIGLKGAASAMADAGVGFVPWQFALLGRLAGMDRNIQAGSYEIAPGVTAWDLLKKLTAGDVLQAEIVLVEGWTFRQFRQSPDSHPDVRHDSSGLTDDEIMRRIGASEPYAEGLFFPDTYLFAKGASDFDILRRAYQAMQRRLYSEWNTRDKTLPYKTYFESIIMASIIEKETGAETDRGKIASVFVNRLRRGMLLQTDPTVIYGMGDAFRGNIKKRDLTTDTPWNTYTRPGLPPTPIGMPGMASIRAALHPPTTDFLYFVARGDGSSVFSRTLEEHNRAVNRYQKSGRG